MATNANWRLDPFVNLYNYETITDEVQTVALDDSLGRYGFRLNEAPRITATGTVLDVVENVTGGAQWLEISSSIAPSVGEYRVDRVFDTGFVEFASGDNGKSFLVSYTGKGSIANINGILDLFSASSQDVTIGGTLTVGSGNVINQSSSCGNFSTTSASYVDVTNLSVTLTAYGEPMRLYLIPDGTDVGFIGLATSADSVGTVRFAYLCDGVEIASTQMNIRIQAGAVGPVNYIPCTSFQMIHTPSSGSRTYKLQARVMAGTNISATVGYAKLVVERLKVR